MVFGLSAPQFGNAIHLAPGNLSLMHVNMGKLCFEVQTQSPLRNTPKCIILPYSHLSLKWYFT